MSQSLGNAEFDEGDGAPLEREIELDPVTESQDAGAKPASSILDSILDVTGDAELVPKNSLQQFLQAETVGEALRLWFGSEKRPQKEQVVRRLSRDVAFIDARLNQQLNQIIHHPSFQKLESSWRGVEYLVDVAEKEYDPATPPLQIKLLDVSWAELEKDFDGAIEIEQSSIYRKVYEDEFGTAGGKPFGAIIGDYSIQPGPNAANPHNDLSILGYMSQVAAAAFCPFIANASPELFELENFSELANTSLDHAQTFNRKDFLQWRSLREKEDSRFVGLVLPRVLMRKPYAESNARVDGFRFQEQVRGENSDAYLWGGAAFAFGGNIAKSFLRTGWLADIRGVQRNLDDGGLVTDLPVEEFGTDRPGTSSKFSTDVIISDGMEKVLSDYGFIPLCDCYDSPFSAFYSVQSIQQPKQFDKEAATTNARISAMIHTMLCVSRFAHYLKIIGRDMMGGFKEPEQLEDILHTWITDYVTADSSSDAQTKARFPLREAKVQVRAIPGKSGAFHSMFHLCPHYEIEGLSAGIRLTTEIR